MSADSWNFLNVAGPFDFTEGPVWTGEVVLFTDIPNNRIMRYNPSNGETDITRDREGGEVPLQLVLAVPRAAEVLDVVQGAAHLFGALRISLFASPDRRMQLHRARPPGL